MSDFTKTTDFSIKDGLTTGDPAKVVKGTELDDEFDNIQTSNNTKANKIITPTINNIITQTSGGDLQDGGDAMYAMARPRCTLVRANTQSLASGVWTEVVWATELEDEGGLWDSGTPTKFTANGGGNGGSKATVFMQFIVQLHLDTASGNERFGIRIRNGSDDLSTEEGFQQEVVYHCGGFANDMIINFVGPVFKTSHGSTSYSVEALQVHSSSASRDLLSGQKQCWANVLQWRYE